MKMIRYPLYFALMLCWLSSFSQIESGTWMLNGRHSYDVLFDRNDLDISDVHANPFFAKTNFGYFLLPNSLIGTGFDFSVDYYRTKYRYEKEIKTSIPIYVRQYFFLGKVKTFGMLQAKLQWVEDSYFFTNGYLGAGINIFLMDNIALEGSLLFKALGKNDEHYRELNNGGIKIHADLGLQFYINGKKATSCFNSIEFAKSYLKKGNYILGGQFSFDFFETNDILTTRLEPSLAIFLKDYFKIGGSVWLDKQELPGRLDPVLLSHGLSGFVEIFKPLSTKFYFSNTFFLQHNSTRIDYHDFSLANAVDHFSLAVKKNDLNVGTRIEIHNFSFTKNLIRAGIEIAYNTPYGEVFDHRNLPFKIRGSSLKSSVIWAWQYFILQNLAFEFKTEYVYLNTYNRFMKNIGLTPKFDNIEMIEERLQFNFGLFYFLNKK